MNAAVAVQGPRITGRTCVWDLLSAPKLAPKCPLGHERFTAYARVVRTFVKFGHDVNGSWVDAGPNTVVTLTLSPADVLAWQMAGAQLRQG